MEYVTDTGLKKKTLQELRTETENGLKQVFGVGFETAVDSPNGLLISQLALANSRLWTSRRKSILRSTRTRRPAPRSMQGPPLTE